MSSIQYVQSFARDTDQILAELMAGFAGQKPSLVLLYASPRDDTEALARAVTTAFSPALVAGCTTAGEIAPAGYAQGSVLAVGLASEDFTVAKVLIDDLRHFNAAAARDALVTAHAKLPAGNCFALTFFDGLCGCEEPVIAAIHAALGEVEVVGGSAGDGIDFRKTYLIHQGGLVDDAALVLLVSTKLPFRTFKSESFVAGEQRLVITAAVPERRLVQEINARPAAKEYARLVGVERDRLGPEIYARHPLMVRVGGANFVRSIQSANDDDTLVFFCAIDTGLVMRVGQSVDMADCLEKCFNSLRREMGEAAAVIAFDCIFRRLELVQTNNFGRVEEVLARNRVLAFSTYGEQFRGMHVNQTLSGVFIGGRS